MASGDLNKPLLELPSTIFLPLFLVSLGIRMLLFASISLSACLLTRGSVRTYVGSCKFGTEKGKRLEEKLFDVWKWKWTMERETRKESGNE